ncbi:hypothetical protein CRUP_033615, partial [Coryphaenoides rupestris]
MRVPTYKLQQLAIYTTLLTGGGIGTMYYLMQKKFVNSEFHRLALARLEMSSDAMDSLGAPPLKVHNIHLTDRDNRIDQHTAKMKIPVTGSKTGGYLYTISTKNAPTNGWQLKVATLKLREGQIFNLLDTPDQPSAPAQGHMET